MPPRHIPSRLSGLRRVAAVIAGFFFLSVGAQADDLSPRLSLSFTTAQSPGDEAFSAPAGQEPEPLAVHELQALPQLPATIDLTAPTDDLWQRIRNGFAMPNLNSDLVLHHQQWYMNRPEYLRRVVDRSRRYMHHIVGELERRGMPTELALLPMVESAYNPMAISPAQASGLWQFIPSTGRNYKLEQNWWQDQRRDIVASTNAALDYLQTIYDMHGDWQLALASYNWGEGAVKRAIEKNIARGLPTDYSSLTMPNETRNYVPKLQALKNIFSNPRIMANLQLPELFNRPYFATIETNRPIDVKTAAKLANMPVDEFVALNPAHNRPVIKGDTPLVIPADKVQTFQENLENHDEPLSRWQTYTLKPGERLDKVAPRFGISLADLKRVNGVHGRLNISAGSTLLVPSGKGDGSLDDMVAVPRLPEFSSRSAGKRQLAERDNRKLTKAEKARVSKLAKGEKQVSEKLARAEKASGRKVARAERSAAAPRSAAGKALAKKPGSGRKAVAAKPSLSSSKVVKSDASSLA